MYSTYTAYFFNNQDEILAKYKVILFSEAQSRAPRIKEHPADTIVGRSEPATLRCVAEGKPKPSIQWYKDGLPLAPTDHPHRVLLEDGLLFLR